MQQQRQLIGHLSAFGAYTIFGFNIIICKNIANLHLISPMGLFTLRSLGASVLFWLLSLCVKKEKVAKQDYWQIFLASMIGLLLTQYTFLKGITMITSLDASIISPITPIFTMLVAAVALKEPITWKKAGGVLLSFLGVILLIFNSVSLGGGATATQPMGVVLLVSNCLLFASYLGIFRPLINRYSVVTFMKWMFLFSFLVSLPFSAQELLTISYKTIPINYYLEVGYLILFATFVAYFLIPVGQKHLRPTLVSMYTYVQPLIASIMSIYLGMDSLTWQKLLAAFAIVTGVVLVNRSRARVQ